jgi:hypothetical protein
MATKSYWQLVVNTSGNVSAVRYLFNMDHSNLTKRIEMNMYM